MLSRGNISRMILYLTGLYEHRWRSLHDFKILSRCSDAEWQWLDRYCERCQLTRLSHELTDLLTDAGKRIVYRYRSDGGCEMAFREFLLEYIEKARPGWAYRMPTGRAETFSVLTRDEYYCFKESGLADDSVSEDVVAWWDKATLTLRSESDVAKLRTGRIGEKLTISYERKRTGMMPKWESVESNFAGYDVLSVMSADDTSPRLIEVKATRESIETAYFHVTRNEWDTAESSMERYYFYLWSIKDAIRVAIVPASVVTAHISTNNGHGEWESVRVPFSAFSEMFSLADLMFRDEA